MHLTVNGQPVEADPPVGELLIDLLRTGLGLTGTKEACSVGVCGACTVLLDGRMVASCLTLAAQADDAEVVTVEGLAEDDRLHSIQESFLERGGLQCGICTPAAGSRRARCLDGNPHRARTWANDVDDRKPLPLHRIPDPRGHRRRRLAREA